MDPDTEKKYRELLKEWNIDDDSIKEKLEEIEGMLELAEKLTGGNIWKQRIISPLNCGQVKHGPSHVSRKQTLPLTYLFWA